EKSFFSQNQMTLGASYRQDYESVMDWAISPQNAYINAFLIGLSTKNYFKVEETIGYISFSKGNTASVRVEYFDENFNSIKKYTNWSLFNYRSKKDDNPPLAPMDRGKLAGMRYIIEGFNHTSFMNSRFIVEMEKTYGKREDVIGEYTRLFGNTMFSWRLAADNILKLRMAGGYSKDFLPAPKSFRLGGLNTLRGYDFESIPTGYPFEFLYGGNRMALCNIDYYFGGGDDMSFVIFADAGNVWLKGYDVNFKDMKRDIGLGLTFGSDFSSIDNYIHLRRGEKGQAANGLCINWAVPVGNVPHVSHWTVNFARGF
ncbi:MAG TPA: BamA/TamA family outer membrane protein, partial [Anaerolineae bacterium]|nr:BamA/TamA family outer membrane protein [Anaerolineae bacterium]